MTAALNRPAAAGPELEFVHDNSQFPSAHASTIVQASDGALLCAFFGGTDEKNPDVGIWLARKEPGAAAWGALERVFKETGQPAWNPVLFRDASGVVWLWFKVGPSPQEWSGGYLKSADGGRTWSEPVWLPAGMLGPVRNKPIALANGDILAGTSFESHRAWASWTELSGDGGRTWTKFGPMRFEDADADRKGTIQPTLLEIEPGVVRALLRTRGMGKIATTLSRDGGRTWAPLALTNLDHPGSGIDAVRLRDGRCLLVYNPSAKRRDPLTLAVSFDGGATWRDIMELDRLGEGVRGELSYPAIIQADPDKGGDGKSGGDIHATWTWKRERIRHAIVPLSEIPRE